MLTFDYETPKGSILLGRRKTKYGREEELVQGFLEQLSVFKNEKAMFTVFREPRLESGYPDIVIVRWNPEIAEKWDPCRADITQEDVKIMHYLSTRGSVSHTDMTFLFTKTAAKSLERLQAAGMIEFCSDTWFPAPLPQIYAASEIIAIEAKISDWRRAVRQAFLNTWFASASYILVPDLRGNTSLQTDAASFGIGVITADVSLRRIIRPAKGKLPISYTSWIFNELVWRAYMLE